jgi:hypothetical protein
MKEDHGNSEQVIAFFKQNAMTAFGLSWTSRSRKPNSWVTSYI